MPAEQIVFGLVDDGNSGLVGRREVLRLCDRRRGGLPSLDSRRVSNTGLDVYGVAVHTEMATRCGLAFGIQGLKRIHASDDAKGVPPAMADKLRKLLFALETAASLDQLNRFPGWNLHPLKGDLRGFWSLTVTGNWRLTFRYNEGANSADDIDLIDYH